MGVGGQHEPGGGCSVPTWDGVGEVPAEHQNGPSRQHGARVSDPSRQRGVWRQSQAE